MGRNTVVMFLTMFSMVAFAQQQQPQNETPPPPPPPMQQQQQQYAPQQPYYPQQYQQPAPQQPYRPLRIDNWNENEPMPEGYHLVTHPRWGLVAGGAATFGATYFISILIAAIGTDVSGGANPFWPQYIPVVGPFIQIGVLPLATVGVYCTLLGLAQAAGVAMFIAGFAAPHKSLVRDALTKNQLMIVPFVSPTANGLALSGRF